MWASLVAHWFRICLQRRGNRRHGFCQEDPLEQELVAPSVPAWRIPWTEEPGGLQATGSHRVGGDWVTSLSSLLCLRHSCTQKESSNDDYGNNGSGNRGTELSESRHTGWRDFLPRRPRSLSWKAFSRKSGRRLFCRYAKHWNHSSGFSGGIRRAPRAALIGLLGRLSGEKVYVPVQATRVWSLGWDDPLKKEMTTHSSILAWEYSCLGNPMERGAWQATVHGVSKSRAWFNDETAPPNTEVTHLFLVVPSLSRVRLYNPMKCSTPGFPVLQHLLSLLSLMSVHPLLPASPLAFNLSQPQALF